MAPHPETLTPSPSHPLPPLAPSPSRSSPSSPIQIGSGGTNLPPDAATRRLHLALVRRHAAPCRLDRPCRSTTTPEPSLAAAARLPVARPSSSSSPNGLHEPASPTRRNATFTSPSSPSSPTSPAAPCPTPRREQAPPSPLSLPRRPCHRAPRAPLRSTPAARAHRGLTRAPAPAAALLLLRAAPARAAPSRRPCSPWQTPSPHSPLRLRAVPAACRCRGRRRPVALGCTRYGCVQVTRRPHAR